MNSQYDNLAQIHEDSRMLCVVFEGLLQTEFNPKIPTSSRTLAACVRLSSCADSLEYLGAYVLKHFSSNPEIFHFADQTPGIDVAKFVIRACKHSRIPLSSQ